MANERSAGPEASDPLTASLGEQLREKAHLDEEAERERRASEEREAAIERRKQEEREAVAAHGGDPEAFRVARQVARSKPVRRQPTLGTLLLVVAGVALFVRLTSRR